MNRVHWCSPAGFWCLRMTLHDFMLLEAALWTCLYRPRALGFSPWILDVTHFTLLRKEQEIICITLALQETASSTQNSGLSEGFWGGWLPKIVPQNSREVLVSWQLDYLMIGYNINSCSPFFSGTHHSRSCPWPLQGDSVRSGAMNGWKPPVILAIAIFVDGTNQKIRPTWHFDPLKTWIRRKQNLPVEKTPLKVVNGEDTSKTQGFRPGSYGCFRK